MTEGAYQRLKYFVPYKNEREAPLESAQTLLKGLAEAIRYRCPLTCAAR
jgi:hypothetical protein